MTGGTTGAENRDRPAAGIANPNVTAIAGAGAQAQAAIATPNRPMITY